MEAGHHFQRNTLIAPEMTRLHYISERSASTGLNKCWYVTKKRTMPTNSRVASLEFQQSHPPLEDLKILKRWFCWIRDGPAG